MIIAAAEKRLQCQNHRISAARFSSFENTRGCLTQTATLKGIPCIASGRS